MEEVHLKLNHLEQMQLCTDLPPPAHCAGAHRTEEIGRGVG